MGGSVWVHSSEFGFLDSSVPHNGLPERLGQWCRTLLPRSDLSWPSPDEEWAYKDSNPRP